MALDRQKTHEIVQALLRAKNRKDGGNILDREPPFGRIGFHPTSQLGVMTGDNAASQSQESAPGPRPHPFRDPARFSNTDEAAELATAHGIPVYDQLAFNVAPSALSRSSNPQTIYGRPLAVNARGIVRPRPGQYSWGSPLPPYGKPRIDPRTFPPLIYQGKEKLTEADKEACHKQFDDDQEQCNKNYSYNTDAWYGCNSRATTIRDLCLRGEKEILPWNDVDQDGVRFNKPGKGRKKK